MNKEDLKNRIMENLKKSLNESKTFDPKNNKVHREAYNSFVKWYNRWKEKLGREEVRALVRKVTNDALGDNLDTINEAKFPGAVDDHLAFDLFLWCENTREIRMGDYQYLLDALVRKTKLGKTLDMERLANSSAVDKIARKTIETYRDAYPNTYVSSLTRKTLRYKIAQHLLEDVDEELHFERLELEK